MLAACIIEMLTRRKKLNSSRSCSASEFQQAGVQTLIQK
jgi:hypothetical protein